MREGEIEFRQASYAPAGAPARIRDLVFSVAPGETLVLLGRSGSGKTTTLKLANGLLRPTSGEVRVAGRPTTAWDPVRLRRRTGYVIQEGGLFPHLTVAENVGIVPALEGWPPRRIGERVEEMLDLVNLPPRRFAQRYPHELSGGERQRVGVARALAADPPIVLMDEPFGALDPPTREELRGEFCRLRERLGKTILFVTHDLREALLVGNRIALLAAGQLVFLGTPEEFLRAEGEEERAFVRTLSGLDRYGPPGRNGRG
jgi:osmoprotectant transport system ATP-binding protein